MSKIKYFLISSVLCFLMLAACKKIDHQNELPNIITGDTSSVQLSSVIITGEVTPNDAPIQISGHVWSSTNQLPGYSANEGITSVNGILPQNKIISTLTNLLPGKTYYIRGYVISGVDTVYGNVINFSTAANNPAIVSTGAVSNITLTGADIAAIITFTGTTPVTQHGIVWSKTNQNPTTSDSVSSLGAVATPSSYTISLSNLSPATTYFARAYVTNNAGTNYGNVVTFTTLSNTPPSVTTDSIISISTNSATAKGNIINTGSSAVTQYGHVWSSVNNLPTINDSKTQLGSVNAPISFGSQLTGLTPNTTYFVRSYAINTIGISYGTVLTFTTGTVPNNPAAVTTGSSSAVTTNAATIAGTINDIGSSPVTQYGHVWSSVNNVPTINDSKSQLGTATGAINFNSQLAGLTASTTYFVRAYAINNGGISYGQVVTFITATPANNPSIVSTGTFSAVTKSSATVSGSITDVGSSPITQYGHVWSSVNNTPTINDNKTQLGSTNVASNFNSQLTALTANTTYYVRAYAINNSGISYGQVVIFITATPANNPAAVSTGTFSAVTTSSATVSGSITDVGSSPVTQYGHVWSSVNNTPTINDNKTQLGSTNVATNFNSQLTGLIANTTYYVRAYAINNGGISYGQVISFSTSSASNISPSVTTGNISSITFSTASAAGNITDIGSPPVTNYGHVWSSTNTVPTIADSKTDLGAASGPTSFNSSLTGLQTDTYYWVRAYAINSAGITYGVTQIFTSAKNDPANINFRVPPDNVTATTATFSGNIYDIGSSPVTQYGLVWSTNSLPTVNDSKTQLGTASGPLSFSSTLTGLTPSTNYYVRAYAINAAGIYYTTQYAFYTANYYPPPSITTGSVSNINFTSATVAGSITNTNNSSITDYGHVWSSTNNVPTINDNKTQFGSSASAINYSSFLTGLTQGTTYYVRAYAINFGGISYGDVVSFTTSANIAATVTTGDPFYQPPGVANSYVDFPGTITSTGNSPVTQHGHVWSKTNTTPTLADNSNQLGTASTGTYNSVFSPNVIPPGTYYVRAYVTNAAGTSYGAVKTFTY